jgi:hypothetical protein
MKNIKILVHLSVAIFLVYFAFSCAGTHDYLSNNFQQIKATHRVIAIVPFDVRFPNPENYSYKTKNTSQQGQGITQHTWSEQERQASLDMQKDLFINLAKQVQKGRYEMAFQDFTKTNKILETNNIQLYDIAAQDKSKLAQILGVDAVIWGQTEVRITRPTRYNPYPYGRYNDGVETTASIYDATTGEMMWSTNQSERPNSNFSTPHDLASRLMDVISRNLPYRLAKK